MLPTNIRLDDYTTYSIEMNTVEKRSRFKVKIDRVYESDNINEIHHYTKEDLEKYWENRNTLDMYLLVLSKEKTSHKRYFIIDRINGLILIPLCDKTKNIVDYTVTNLDYYDKISEHSLYRNLHKNGKKYARTRTTSMHEIIFGRKASKGHKIDHKNSNGMDNRIENLREVTDLENGSNINTYDKLIGICWRVKHNKWEASIKLNRKNHFLGLFKDKIEAAKQYDRFSVHLFPNTKQLNQINGKSLLTEEEIDEVKNNPKKYSDFLNRNVNKKKKDGLPKNIRLNDYGNYNVYKIITRFFVKEENGNEYLSDFKNEFDEYKINALLKTKLEKRNNLFFFNVKISKTFKKLKEAINFKEDIKQYIDDLDQIEREKLEKDIDNYRNEEGIAVLKVRIKRGVEEYVDALVSDEDWLEFIHYTWWFSNGGYPTTDKLGDLHIIVFKRWFPEEYANRKDDESIDHKNIDPLDATIENLRLANKSLQVQNRKVEKSSLVPFQCVHIICGSFYAIYKDKRYPVKYSTAEEASRKYNELAYNDNPDSRMNVIPDTKTTVADIYGKENLKKLDINNISTLQDIKEIFRYNKIPRDFNYHDMRIKNIQEYRNIIIKYLNEN
jgi:hypothetical protein